MLSGDLDTYVLQLEPAGRVHTRTLSFPQLPARIVPCAHSLATGPIAEGAQTEKNTKTTGAEGRTGSNRAPQKASKFR
jgi:hypothetical protein